MSENATGELRDSGFRPWLVMIGCCLMMATCFSIPATCSTLFIVPVCEEFGFGRGAFTISTSIMGLVQLISMPMAAKVLGSKKVNSRITVSLCVLIIAGGFALLSAASALWHWYVLYGIMGFITPWCTVVAISIFINNWFKDRLGLAMGIASAASGVGSAILSPIFTNYMAANGWRSTYIVMAAYVIIAGLPLSATVMTFSPDRIGMLPYETKKSKEKRQAMAGNAEASSAGPVEIPGAEASVARRNAAFFMLFGVTVLFGFSSAVNTHAAAMMYGAFDIIRAGMFLSMLQIGVAGGKILLGMVNDKFGSKVCGAFGCLSFVLGLVLVIISTASGNYPMACLAGIFTGIGLATTTFTPALLTAGAFGRKNFSVLYSTIMTGFTIGSAVGAPLVGTIYDVSASYTVALVVIIVAVLLALFLALTAIRIGQKLWKAA